MPPEQISAFRCPRCGNDPSLGKIRYLETIQCHRAVKGVENGSLLIESEYGTEGYDDGENPEFECHGRTGGPSCDHRWSVPDWVGALIDWV